MMFSGSQRPVMDHLECIIAEFNCQTEFFIFFIYFIIVFLYFYIVKLRVLEEISAEVSFHCKGVFYSSLQ